MGIYDIVDKLKKEVEEEYFLLVERAIYDVFDVTLDMLRKKSRKRNIVEMRYIFCHYCREQGLLMMSIGDRIDKDHATVVHYLRQYDDLYNFDKEFKVKADLVSRSIKNIENAEQ